MYQFSSDAAAAAGKASSSISPGDITASSQTAQMTAAMNFFARAGQKIHGSSSTSKKKRKSENKLKSFHTSFHNVLKSSPPIASMTLFQLADTKESSKVKVLLRVVHLDGYKGTDGNTCVSVDQRRKQVTLFDPGTLGGFAAPSQRRAGTSLPKLFAFDAVFNENDSLTEICCNAVTDIVQAVVGGVDGCVFSFGQNRLGKSFTMIGTDASNETLGVIPCAIAWLFQLINEQKEQTGARFSVRVSAVEICGKEEKLKDLLSDIAAVTDANGHTAPGVYLRDDPISGTQIENQSELRAPSAEKAAFYLDAALSQRSKKTAEELEEDSRNTHLLFTLHIYQYRIEKSSGSTGVTGGRSRLHLIDLGSGRSSNTASAKDCAGGGGGGGSGAGTDASLSLPALGSVIMALVNGQRHIPYRDSKTSQLLREALGSLACRVCMIAHVSSNAQHYCDTLQVVQLASKISRLRRRHKVGKLLYASGDDNNSCDSFAVRRAGRVRPHMSVLREGVLLSSALTSSENEYTSSSEQSCDTVIYLGGRTGRDFVNEETIAKKVSTPLGNKSDSDSLNNTKIDAPIVPEKSEPETQDAHVSAPQLIANMALLKSSEEHCMSLRANAKCRSKMTKRDAIETLSTQKEQWVDGPHAFYCPPNIGREEVLTANNFVEKQEECAQKWTDRPNIPQNMRSERRQSNEAVERPAQLPMVDAATQFNEPLYSVVNKKNQLSVEEAWVNTRSTAKGRKPMMDDKHSFSHVTSDSIALQRLSFPIQAANCHSSYMYTEENSARFVESPRVARTKPKPFVQDWVAKHSVLSSVESNICAAAEKAVESQCHYNSYQYPNSENNMEEKHYFSSTHSSPLHTQHRNSVTTDELRGGKPGSHIRHDVGIFRKHFQKPLLHQQINHGSTNFSRVAEWVQSVANDSSRAQSLSPTAIESNVMYISMSTASDLPSRSNDKLFTANSLDRKIIPSPQLLAYRGVRNANRTGSGSQVTSSALSETDHEMERVWFSSTGEHKKQPLTDSSGNQFRRSAPSQPMTQSISNKLKSPLAKSTGTHRLTNVSVAPNLAHRTAAVLNQTIIPQSELIIPALDTQKKDVHLKLMKGPMKDEFHEAGTKVTLCKNSPQSPAPSSFNCGSKPLSTLNCVTMKSVQGKDKEKKERSESVSSANSSHSSKEETEIDVSHGMKKNPLHCVTQVPVLKPLSTKDSGKRDRIKNCKHPGKDTRTAVVAQKEKENGKQLIKDHHHYEHQRGAGSRFMELSGRGGGRGNQARGHSSGADGVSMNNSVERGHHKKSANSATNNYRILSPYHTVTQPRISVHSSSGHGSDYSSLYGIKSRTGRKMRHGGTSSGYESILRDSEASSHNDSASESSISGVVVATPRISSSSSSSRSRSQSAPPNSGDSEERTPSIISVKMYSPQECPEQSTADTDELHRPIIEETEEIGRQIRREKIIDKLTRLDNLKIELIEAKEMLMVDRSSWSFDLHVVEQMDPDHPGFLEALDKELEIMKKRVDACKSHIMMITSFDIKKKRKIAPISTPINVT